MRERAWPSLWGRASGRASNPSCKHSRPDWLVLSVAIFLEVGHSVRLTSCFTIRILIVPCGHIQTPRPIGSPVRALFSVLFSGDPQTMVCLSVSSSRVPSPRAGGRPPCSVLASLFGDLAHGVSPSAFLAWSWCSLGVLFLHARQPLVCSLRSMQMVHAGLLSARLIEFRVSLTMFLRCAPSSTVPPPGCPDGVGSSPWWMSRDHGSRQAVLLHETLPPPRSPSPVSLRGPHPPSGLLPSLEVFVHVLAHSLALPRKRRFKHSPTRPPTSLWAETR